MVKKINLVKVGMVLLALVLVFAFNYDKFKIKSKAAEGDPTLATEIKLSDYNTGETEMATINLATDSNGYRLVGSPGTRPIKIVVGIDTDVYFDTVTINNFEGIYYNNSSSDSTNKIIMLAGNHSITSTSANGSIFVGNRTNFTLTGEGNLTMNTVIPCIAFTNSNSVSSEINIKDTTVTLVNSATNSGSTLGLLPGPSGNPNTVVPGVINIEGSSVSAASAVSGIGAGYGNGKNVTINIKNCKTIEGKGGCIGAGIGGGAYCGNSYAIINIENVETLIGICDGWQAYDGTGKKGCGAGIGGGNNGAYAKIKIVSVGSISAASYMYGAAIGGGINNSCADIEIQKVGSINAGLLSVVSSSNVPRKRGDDGAGIGAGYSGSSATVTIEGVGTINAEGQGRGAGIGGGYGYSLSGGSKLSAKVSIKDVNSITATGGSKAGSGIGGGDNSGNNESSVVKITLEGIGNINATSPVYGAGIGAGYTVAHSEITIKDCPNITAKSGASGGAAIGGGYNNSSAKITIENNNEGEIKTAVGGENAGAGIGGGHTTSSANVTISGVNKITANNSTSNIGAGIGGGYSESNGNISIINVSEINANGGKNAAAIGGGNTKSNGTIEIKNANKLTVTNSSADNGAGIGGGCSESEGDVKIINVKEINTTAGKYGAGIGGGSTTSPAIVVIENAESLVAKAGYTAGAGIGGGYSGSEADVRINDVDSITQNINLGSKGAGIGGGNIKSPATVIITKASVINANGQYGAGIGGGNDSDVNSSFGTVNISDVELINAGSYIGAAIGGGYGAGTKGILSFDKVDEIVAKAGTGAGIGSGYDNNNFVETISLSGIKKISASARCFGAGIGGGYGLGKANIEITEAELISATSAGVGAGIGEGQSLDGKSSVANVSISDVLEVNASARMGAGIGGGFAVSAGAADDLSSVETTDVGTLNAKSQTGAGIGGGVTSGAFVNINGVDEINASTNFGGGIGQGFNACTDTLIDISNIEKLMASANKFGAGIGGGYGHIGWGRVPAKMITTITNVNEILATSGDEGGAGIGGGNLGYVYISEINIENVPTIYAISNGTGAGIGGGNAYSDARVNISSASSIYPLAKNGAGIGGGRLTSYGYVTISNADLINTEHNLRVKTGAGIGGGDLGGVGVVTISAVKTINAVGAVNSAGCGIGAGAEEKSEAKSRIFITGVSIIDAFGARGNERATGAAIGHAMNFANIFIANEFAGAERIIPADFHNSYPACSVMLLGAVKINAYAYDGNAAIGSAVDNAVSQTITLAGMLSVKAIGGENAAAIGSGDNNTNLSRSKIYIGNTELEAIADNEVEGEDIDEENSDGIIDEIIDVASDENSDEMIDENAEENSEEDNDEQTSEVNNSPEIIAVSGEYQADETNCLNNICAIGSGATPEVVTAATIDIQINSGIIHAIDSNQSTHSSAVGVPNSDVNSIGMLSRSSLVFNGGDTYMYGSATFYVKDKGIELKENATLHIGYRSPRVENYDGRALIYGGAVDTTIRNFKDNGLIIDDNANVFVNPSDTDTYIGYEYDNNTDLTEIDDEGLLGNSYLTEYNGRGLAEKFETNVDCDFKINTATAKWDSIMLEKYSLSYNANIFPKHTVEYGVSQSRDPESIEEWVMPNTDEEEVVLGNLLPETTYYVFVKLDSNPYFAGEGFENNEIKTLKIETPERRTFTVTFLNNGGEGVMDSVKVLEDARLVLPKNTFTRNNFSFLAWNTDPLGREKYYGDKYTFKKYTVAKDLYLYAIWIGDKFNKNVDQKLMYKGSDNGVFNTGAFNFNADFRLVILGLLIFLSAVLIVIVVRLKKNRRYYKK